MRIITNFLVMALLWAAATAAEVRLLDLEPNDAQNLIERQDQTLKYAPKIASNVPAVRFLGQEPHNVLEDVYEAKQYHGQDGLGGYLYGYQVPDIAKNERKNAGGDLKGAYHYVNGAGQEIRVEYWDDGTGFHQVDNVPEILPQQIDDLPEVKAAKDAFLKRWQEEAERNQRPVQNPYNSAGQYAAGPLSAQGQKERAAYFATLPPSPPRVAVQAAPTSYQTAASVPASSFVQSVPPKSGPAPAPQPQDDGAYTADEEGRYVPGADELTTAGPPRGFFYAYDYPVGIITKDQGRILPLKQVYETNKERFQRQLEKSATAVKTVE